jgi:hypothetical protein
LRSAKRKHVRQLAASETYCLPGLFTDTPLADAQP